MNPFYEKRLNGLKDKLTGKLIDFFKNTTKTDVVFEIGGKNKCYEVTLNFDKQLNKDFDFLYKIIDVIHVYDTYYNLKLEKTILKTERKKEFYINSFGEKCCKITNDNRAINFDYVEIIQPYDGNVFDFANLIAEYEDKKEKLKSELILYTKLWDLNILNDLTSKCGNYNLNFKLCYWKEHYDTKEIYYALRLKITELNTNNIVFNRKIKKDLMFKYLNSEYKAPRLAVCEYFFKKYCSEIKEIDFDFGSEYFLFAEKNNLEVDKNYTQLMFDFENFLNNN